MPDPSVRPVRARTALVARRRPAARPGRAALAVAMLAVAVGGSLAATGAQAQLYRQVGPDGRVTYSDLPPAGAAVDARPRATGTAASDQSGAAGLPYALRGPAARHPVTLFTSAQCAPCDDARAHLLRRGVPFSERSVRSSTDAAAFRQLGFADPSFPAVSVGTQRLTGFEAGAWDQLLDLAGYPKQSMLPANWRTAPTRPLAGASERAGTGAASDAASAANARSAAAAPGAEAASASAVAARAPEIDTAPRSPSFDRTGTASGATAAGSSAAAGASGFRF